MIEVSSQNRNSRKRLSLHTSPNIEPANSTSTAAVRARAGPAWKYDAEYQNTHNPTTATSSTRIIENQSRRRSIASPRPVTHWWDSVKGPVSLSRTIAHAAQPMVHSGRQGGDVEDLRSEGPTERGHDDGHTDVDGDGQEQGASPLEPGAAAGRAIMATPRSPLVERCRTCGDHSTIPPRGAVGWWLGMVAGIRSPRAGARGLAQPSLLVVT